MALLTPEFLQTKTYSALRDRIALSHSGAIQPGVWRSSDYKVVQRGAGANMSVDVGLGDAIIFGNNPGNGGFYHITNDATVNVAVGPSHASLPRIDQIVLTINDTTHGGDATDAPALEVLAGTATAGATLDNRTGAAALGDNQLRLADVLVPAASTTVVTANIRDRRPWARGAYRRITRNANAAAGNDYSTTVQGTASFADIDATNLAPRLELSGVSIRVVLRAGGHTTPGAAYVYTRLMDNGVALANHHTWRSGASSDDIPGHAHFIEEFEPSAGSHQLKPQFATSASANTAVLRAQATRALVFTIEEITRDNAENS